MRPRGWADLEPVKVVTQAAKTVHVTRRARIDLPGLGGRQIRLVVVLVSNRNTLNF